MTQRGDIPFGPDSLPPSQQRRIHADVDDLLSNPALTDADADARINQLLDDLMPAPAPAAAPTLTPPPPPPLEDWAQDHAPLAPPPPPAPPELTPAPRRQPASTATPPAPGGGQVQPPPTRPAAVAPAAVPTPDWEDRYGLWTPPAPPELVVPDDVEDITPVDDPFPTGPVVAAAPSPDLHTPPPPPDPTPAGHGPVRRRWNALPSWAQIAIPTAAALTLALLAATTLVGGGSPAPAAHPPLTPVTEIAPPTPQIADGPLLPQSVTAQCPPGSSDPSLAFGTDQSQAWICTRLYNIDNSILTITFNQPVVVSSIMVMPGFNYVEPNGEDHWNQHRLVTQIKWRLGGTELIQDIMPTRAGAVLQVPNLATQVITATIMATEPPPAAAGSGPLPGIFGGPDAQKVDGSMAISRIEITGRNAGGPA